MPNYAHIHYRQTKRQGVADIPAQELADDKDGEQVFKHAIYPPGAESFITVAEVERLRKVEIVARELAERLNNVSAAHHNARISWESDQLIGRALDRARAAGLLPR